MDSYVPLVVIVFIWMSQTKIKGLNFIFSKKKLIISFKINFLQQQPKIVRHFMLVASLKTIQRRMN